MDNLQSAIMHGGETAFDLVPTCLYNVLKERQWEGRVNKDGKPFASFEEFATYKLWWGLESSIEDLLAFCRKRKDVAQLIRAEVGQLSEHGANQHTAGGDNITSSDEDRGTSPTYALRRLKRDRPDLAQRVVLGEMSANAAACEAGFRKRIVSVPDDDEAAAKAIVRRMGRDRARRVADLIYDISERQQ